MFSMPDMTTHKALTRTSSRFQKADVFEDREVKFSPLNLKRVTSDGIFEGYACIFGEEDAAHDIILPGAFQESLSGRNIQHIKMLYQHDQNEPIGVWLELREDNYGLYVRGQIMPDVVRGCDVLNLMRAGALDGLSIGFRTVKGRRNQKTGIRRLVKIDLWEISIVTFPMQAGARVQVVKHRPFEGRIPTEREIERYLTQDAGLTRSQARTAIVAGFKTLVAKQDAAGGYRKTEHLAAAMTRAAQIMRNP